jgi:SAM-dependent methyltransferase
MQLIDIVRREPLPQPWAEGEKIPWDDPAFSGRMLSEHLSQSHDAASRRQVLIDQHVATLHQLLGSRPGRVLDLGCGPGLYTSRLARLGHCCVGYDFGPAAIAYARAEAQRDGLACSYVQQDLRAGAFGEGFDLAMMLFGELNVFRPADAAVILAHARTALAPDGLLVLEVSTAEAVRAMGQRPRSWDSNPAGLFADGPHLLLTEALWDEAERVTIERYYVVDAATGAVQRHASTTQAYTRREQAELLQAAGFGPVHHRESMALDGQAFAGFEVVIARR